VSIDIALPQDEVFAYVTDPSRFAEWQAGVLDGSMEDGATDAVGTKCMTTRRIGGAEREATARVSRLDPPRAWAVRGIDGPIRANVDVAVDRPDVTAGSRVTIVLDFEGRGIGKLLVPLIVRRQACKEMPANMVRLKSRIEATRSPPTQS
jgi:uncharacterized protein YndB with AHSA1/START domain